MAQKRQIKKHSRKTQKNANDLNSQYSIYVVAVFLTFALFLLVATSLTITTEFPHTMSAVVLGEFEQSADPVKRMEQKEFRKDLQQKKKDEIRRLQLEKKAYGEPFFKQPISSDAARLNKELKISSESGNIIKKNIKEKPHFPLSINPETNELIVTTPAGTKVVTVLPDRAVENMLKKNIISTTSSQLDGSGAQISERNKELVYTIKGKKKQKLFGIIPVTSDVTAYVSAESGELVAKDQSLLDSVVDFLSP